jgi:hypothetical protein
MTGKQQILEALKANGYEVLGASGGFFIRDMGFVSYSKAKALAGLKGNLTERTQGQRMTAYGDWAIIAAINGQLNG